MPYKSSTQKIRLSFEPPIGGPSAQIKQKSKTSKDTTYSRLGWYWGGKSEKPNAPQGDWVPPGAGGGSGMPFFAPKTVALGYHPDLPDLRDYQLDKPKKEIPESVQEVLEEIKKQNVLLYKDHREKLTGPQIQKKAVEFKSYLLHEIDELPARHDLRETGYFSPVEDQEDIGSCTAQAVIGLVEYLMRAGGLHPMDMSRMFLYKVTRRLLGWTGDTGAYLRTTIKAMALFGVPPEYEWPYKNELLDEEPDSYNYSFAQNFKALTYARLDGYGEGSGGGNTLNTIRRTLADGFPVVFGFPVHRSISSVRFPEFVIHYPQTEIGDSLIGGHAVLAVGFDDKKITLKSPLIEKRGALIIRNSWGQQWGESGYAYLPYEYVTNQLAVDFWSIFNKDWINLQQFG
jgi:C1A family cysteine protease